MSKSYGLLYLIGRILFSLPFLASGAYSILNFSNMLQLVDLGYHVPLPAITFSVEIALQVIGGLSIMLGLYVRFGAACILVVSIMIIIFYHNFWHYSNDQFVAILGLFIYDISMVGACLVLIAAGSGPYSLSTLFFPEKNQV